jgi:hypothetical protein
MVVTSSFHFKRPLNYIAGFSLYLFVQEEHNLLPVCGRLRRCSRKVDLFCQSNIKPANKGIHCGISSQLKCEGLIAEVVQWIATLT